MITKQRWSSEMEMGLEGVFEELVDERFFVDKIVIAVWGMRRQRIGESVHLMGSRGIAGPNSPYARLASAVYRYSGNQVQWKFGKYLQAPWCARLAPYRFALRSVGAPATCSELYDVVDSVLLRGSRHCVSLVEFTADTHFAMEDLRRDLFTRARYMREIGDEDPVTLYVGSPRSPWQLRIYQKTKAILRVELVARPPLLRALGMLRATDLLKFRTIDLRRFARWQEVPNPLSVLARVERKASGWKKEACAEVLRWSTRDFAQIVRVNYGVRDLWLRPSAVESTLKHMQRNFIW